MSRHARHSLRTPVLLFVALVALVAVLDMIAVVMRLWPLLAIGAVVLVAWRAGHCRILPPQGRGKVLQGRAEPDRTADLEAENVELRRQVTKLEGDAARTDQLLDDLEHAAGRPVEAILASYQKIQRQYGPAAVSKTGGSR